jgi:hypothetical protein
MEQKQNILLPLREKVSAEPTDEGCRRDASVSERDPSGKEKWGGARSAGLGADTPHPAAPRPPSPTRGEGNGEAGDPPRPRRRHRRRDDLPAGGPPLWPAGRIAELTRLFAAGLSHGLIAQALGLERGAVSGKLNRLGLKREKPAQRKPTEIRVPRPGPETRRPDLPAGRMVPLWETSGCRWPTAEAAGVHLFCDAHPAEGSPYCPAHAAAAVRPGAAQAQQARLELWLKRYGRRIR